MEPVVVPLDLHPAVVERGVQGHGHFLLTQDKKAGSGIWNRPVSWWAILGSNQ